MMTLKELDRIATAWLAARLTGNALQELRWATAYEIAAARFEESK